jgi:hypothetical protein
MYWKPFRGRSADHLKSGSRYGPTKAVLASSEIPGIEDDRLRRLAIGAGKVTMKRTRVNAPVKIDPLTEAERVKRREQSLDEALQASFPASDPPAAVAPGGPSK